MTTSTSQGLHDQELRELAGEELWVLLLVVPVLNTFSPGSAGGREGTG